jgi:DNA-binding NtrC family response regulator
MSTIVVLVVDDDDGVRQAMAEVLEDEGYAVMLAENGRRALEQIDAQVPALLITDLDMPELGGEQLVRRVRAQHPELPILVITARIVVDAHAEAARLTVMSYLNKPVDVDVLIAEIRRALGPL